MDPPCPGRPARLVVLDAMRVSNLQDAQTALLAAVHGSGLLILSDAERDVLDDLVEDLSRIGPVWLVDRANVIQLEPKTRRLLHALSGGTSISVAARALNLSIRTAVRRIADAKTAMGSQTSAAVVRSLSATARIPAATVKCQVPVRGG